jgi:hypothetical protein
MKPANRERKLVLLFSGAVFLLIAAASLLAPVNDDSDKSPTTYNSGTAGIKAAYLLLGDLGYSTARWLAAPNPTRYPGRLPHHAHLCRSQRARRTD